MRKKILNFSNTVVEIVKKKSMRKKKDKLCDGEGEKIEFW